MVDWYCSAYEAEDPAWKVVAARGWTVIWSERPEEFAREMRGAVEVAHAKGEPCTCGFSGVHADNHHPHWRITPLGHKLLQYAMRHNEIDEFTVAIVRACEQT
jgi:hypothetical protein